MAKDPIQAQLKAARSKAEKAQGDLDKLKESHRKNPTVESRAAVREAILKLGPLLDEQAELARAVSRMAGGKQFGIEP
jgi:hypothetical protein